MSVDALQEKIRKLKNPSVVDFFARIEHIPAHIVDQEGSFIKAYGRFCTELLLALKDTVPAVRFSFGSFALLGAQGLDLLEVLTKTAKIAGFYVLLDAVETASVHGTQVAAQTMLSPDCPWKFDALVLSSYMGSDGIKPYADKLRDSDKALFVTIRTANRSAGELQDLMTGSRLMHLAKADVINLMGAGMTGRSGYSRIGGVGAATSADSLKKLRSKYPNMFLLVDGFDYPGANAKNCGYAFDKLGHGAAACAGTSVIAAWQETETEGLDYAEDAVRAAERMKKNLLRYITVL